MRKLKFGLERLISPLALLFFLLLGFYIFKILNKVKIEGRKNIPRGRNILFVSNHETLIDSLLIGMGVARWWEPFFRYHRIPWNAPDRKNFFSRPLERILMDLLKTIPVDRGCTKKEVTDETLERFYSVLRSGRLLLFFEGTRTRNGEIGPTRAGVARTIYFMRPIVIPVLLENIQPIMPIESGFNFFKIYRKKRGRMIIGKPIVFSDLSDLRKIKDEVKISVENLKV